MKERTIEELHDRHVGHQKFARVVDTLVNRGYAVTDIKEYYEKFKFKVDGYLFEYDKVCKPVVDKYCEWLIDIINSYKALEGMKCLTQ